MGENASTPPAKAKERRIADENFMVFNFWCGIMMGLCGSVVVPCQSSSFVEDDDMFWIGLVWFFDAPSKGTEEKVIDE